MKNITFQAVRPTSLKHLLRVTLLLVSFTQPLVAQTPINKIWDRAFGGSGHDHLQTILKTPDGGYILGGHSNSGSGGEKSEASRGEWDYWVVKVDASGNKEWDKSFGGDGEDFLRALTRTPDGGYLLGGSSSSRPSGDKTEHNSNGEEYDIDYWVVKISADGSKVWDRTFGGDKYDEFHSLTATPDGGFLLGGYSRSGASGDKTEASRGGNVDIDFWVVKLNADGSKAWDRTLGGTGIDILNSLVTTPDGGYLLGGQSSSVPDGDKTEAKGGNDFWVVKLNADGSKAWDRTYGGSKGDVLNTLIKTPDGAYLLGGTSSSPPEGDKTESQRGETDYWVVKIDDDGNRVWDRTLGGSTEDILTSLAMSPDGGYILGGRSTSNAGGDKTEDSMGGINYSSHDFWVVKLNADGSTAWDKTFGGFGNDILNAVYVNPDGSCLVGGSSGSGSGEDRTEGSRGGYDFWLLNFMALPNSTPTDITLSNNLVDENVPADTVVGTLTTIDGDAADTHTYTLVSGSGDLDNNRFTIEKNNLKIITAPDFEAQSTYSIRVKTSDGKTDGTFEKAFAITVTDVNEAPTGITLSSSELDENNAVGDVVGTLAGSDPDAGDTHAFALIGGDGSADNASFEVEGNKLRAALSFDYETKSNFSIRILVRDSGGLSYEAVKTVTINDVQETVTGITEEVNSKLKVYPNPADDYLMISSDKQIEHVYLVNSHGSRVLAEKAGAKQVRVNTQHLAQGIYTALIHTTGKTYSRRVVIVR